MARKSKYTSEVQKADSTAVWLAGVYTRLSIEDNDSEQNSIINQKKIAVDYLEDKSDIVVTEYYCDNGYTGMNFNRPDYHRMMNDLRIRKINCIIVKDISRLGRNFVMTSELVEKVFPMMNVRLICINDDYDSNDEMCDSTALLLPFKMVMNDVYVKDISQKIRSSITAKMEQGAYLPSASSIPYGYIRNPKENTFDVDEETAPIVLRIFQMRASGMGLNAICKELNAEGIPSPGKLRYIRGITAAPKFENALWIHGTLRKLLEDQVYLGNRVHGKVKRDKIGMEKTKRSKDEWKIVEGAHPPIVSKELFDKVQEVMQAAEEKRQAMNTIEAPEIDHREIFRRKVFCGDCGSLMRSGKGISRIGKKSGKRIIFLYYDCGKYLDSGKTVCSSHYVRQEDIMAAVRNALNHQLRVSVDLETLMKEVQAMPKVVQHNSAISGMLRSVQAKRRNLEQRMEQLIVDLTEGLIDKGEYTYAKKRYSRDYEALLEEENQLLAKAGELSGIVASSDKWIKLMKEYEAFPEINRKVVEQLVDRIVIYPNRHIEIHLNYQDPFKAITNYLKRVPEVTDDAG